MEKTMNEVQIVEAILSHIGEDQEGRTVDVMDKLLANACLIILNGVEKPEAPKPKEQKPKEQKPKKTGGRRKKFDMGKLGALTDGGWSVKDIADELGCSEQTVRNKQKERAEQEAEK